MAPAVHADFSFKKIAGGFERPLWVGCPPGAKNHLWVAEQDGRIRIVDTTNGKVLDPPFLDLTGTAVHKDNEQGLLGLAFAPDFLTSGRFYVNYTDTKGDTRVSRITADKNKRLQADPATEERLLFIDQPYSNHNGGWLCFGPDGMLYIGQGDGGAANDPSGNGQRLSTHLGKILRIDVSPDPRVVFRRRLSTATALVDRASGWKARQADPMERQVGKV